MYKNLDDSEDVNIENNKSKADLIISIKTGLDSKLIMMIVITIIVLIILVYCIKEKKIFKFMSFMFVIMISFVTISNSVFDENYKREHGETYNWNIKLAGKNENGKWKYIGYNMEGTEAKWFNCMDQDFPLCSYNDHYYFKYGEDIMEYKESKEHKLEEYINITKNTNKKIEVKEVEDNKGEKRFICGPYSLTTNNSVNTKYEFFIKYNNNSDYIDINSKNGKDGIKILQSDGKTDMPDDFIHLPRKDHSFEFYLSLPKNVTIINSVKVKFATLEEVVTYENWNFVKEQYYCVGIGDGEHRGGTKLPHEHNCHIADKKYCEDGNREYRYYIYSDGESVDLEAKACQRMEYLTAEKRKGDDTKNVMYDDKTSWDEDIVLDDGELNITKIDSDRWVTLEGAKFKITGPSYPEGKSFTTNKDGNINVSGLILGEYTVEEIEAPDGYNINLQTEKYWTANLNKHKTQNNTFYNKKYGNLVITKTDKDTGKALKDVGFKIYKINENGYYGYIMDEAYKDLKDVNNITHTYDENRIFYMTSTNKEEEAYEFKTDENGQIILKNIPLGTYGIKETSVSDEMQGYYETELIDKKVNVETDGDTKIEIDNKQVYTDLSGYVWEDVADTNKNTLRNDLYESPETLVEGITVRLKDYNGQTIDTRTTDSKGAYKFTKVKIDELPNYHIEFEYNGLKYESVTAVLDKDNGSKVSEDPLNRKNFNKSFASITGGNSKDKTTTGYSRDENGTIKNILTYENGENKSTLVQNTGYTSESTKGKITAQNNSMGATMYADTKSSEFELKWNSGAREISNINLGLYERAQPDLAITSDIDNVKLNINGYEDTCHYNERSEFINDLLPDSEDYKEKSAFSVSVKNKNGKYKDTTYTREIYDSYIAFTKSNDSNETNRLRVYVTYKIVVKNESSLISKVSLKDYVDKRYENAQIIASKCYYNGNSSDVNWTYKGEEDSMNVYETELIDQYIDPNSSMTIYLTYEVTKEGILYLLSNDETTPLKHTTEIKSYSIFDSNRESYAGIDIDSAPDNIKYGDTNTYEDDTDSATDLKLKRKESKKILGLVFEDGTEAGTTLNTKGERKGNGMYDENENVVQNAKVELLNYHDNSIAKLYSIDDDEEDKIKVNDANAITNEGGRYTLEGLIPGQYYIEYTYGTFDYNGENKNTVIKTNSGDVPVTTQSYKSTILNTSDFIAQPNKTFKDLFESSYDDLKNNFDEVKDSNALWYWYQNTNKSSATDNMDIRKKINEKLSNITYNNENEYLSGKSDKDLYLMKSNTAIMDIAIEKYNYQEHESTEFKSISSEESEYQMTFGIVERPRQSLKLTKEINYVKVTLANGTVLVEGDPRNENLPYVVYPKGGSLKVEADDEITQGATLEVKWVINVQNNSEIDYNSDNYYKYGIIDRNKDKVENLTINSIIDYLDEELRTNYTNENAQWKMTKAGEMKENKLIADYVYNTVKNKNNIFVNNCNMEILPGENSGIEIEASKLLSSKEEMQYTNYAEVLSASNKMGRFYGEEVDNKWKYMTPGNYDYEKSETWEGDDNEDGIRAKFSILTSTGDSTIIYYLIGISGLIVTAGGIILIKKFIL